MFYVPQGSVEEFAFIIYLYVYKDCVDLHDQDVV